MIQRKYHNSKAQSSIEYFMVALCIAAALYCMDIYIKRSIQGRLKDAADEVGEQYSANNTTSTLIQYIRNPKPSTINGITKFIEVTDPVTGTRENREIMEITRHEETEVQMGNPAVPTQSYEETGKLSNEKLF